MTPTVTPTYTRTPCPQATPEPFWVDPVTSPTDALAQVITVHIGNGDLVGVNTESGAFSVSGDFSVAGPAQVTITLFPNTTHHLEVAAHVKQIRDPGGCTYGNYLLRTSVSQFGAPLVIAQSGHPEPPSPTPTTSRTPTVTPTGSRSHTPTSTPTSSPSHTPTPEPTLTPTATPTASGSPTNSPTLKPFGTFCDYGDECASGFCTNFICCAHEKCETGETCAIVTGECTVIGSPTASPSHSPTESPSATATESPTASPSESPSATITSTPSATPTPCAGDCNRNGHVEISEVVAGALIAVGDRPLTTCHDGDANLDGQITIDELTRAVRAAVFGCCTTGCQTIR